MRYRDYYEVMGVARGASQDEIKRSYRKLARKFHPDVSKEKNAEDKFKELQEAYEVLKDPEKRAAYDQLGADWRQGQEFRPPPDWGKGFEFSRGAGAGGGADFSDFFSQLFGAGTPFGRGRGPAGVHPGGSRGSRRAGEDHVARIDIDLSDAYRGATRNIEVRSPQMSGDGHVQLQPRTLKVTIPAGITQGQQIRLVGQGSPSLDGAHAGDLYIEVNIRPHPAFQLDGRNVTVELPVAPWEAALGEAVAVPTLGGPVEMKLPVGARAGQKLRLKGRGLPGQPAGDQFAVLKIVLPPDSPRLRELFEQMKREIPFDARAGLSATS
jgi:curved DNA-binding protein